MGTGAELCPGRFVDHGLLCSVRLASLQDTVLPSLSSVFASLLEDRNWLLEQHALEAFTRFAEVRPPWQ